MSDRPVTLIIIAVAILLALWLRRARGGVHTPIAEMVSPEQMKREGALRGIEVNMSKPLTREQFERILGPTAK